MRILVTAGNTLAPIDRVRGITNIFTGRTGTLIALAAAERGHHVTLLSSNSYLLDALLAKHPDVHSLRLDRHEFRTFDELHDLLADQVLRSPPDAVIHTAAVSDYRCAEIRIPAGSRRNEGARAEVTGRLEPVGVGKLTSGHDEIWLRLVPTPKLVDLFRRDWNYRGWLVKFKLEVGVGESQLIEIAEKSRRQSAADLMVANTLEDAADWALVGPIGGEYVRIARGDLPIELIEALETLNAGAG